jgi:hypothetical protein
MSGEHDHGGDARRLENIKLWLRFARPEALGNNKVFYFGIDFLTNQIDARDAALREARAEIDQAIQYLTTVFKAAAPQCEPFGRLLNLCTQIDNLIAGQRIEIERLRVVADAARRVNVEYEKDFPMRSVPLLRKALAALDAAPDDGNTAAAERAKIVALLVKMEREIFEETGGMDCGSSAVLRQAIDAIKHGEHLIGEDKT